VQPHFAICNDHFAICNGLQFDCKLQNRNCKLQSADSLNRLPFLSEIWICGMWPPKIRLDRPGGYGLFSRLVTDAPCPCDDERTIQYMRPRGRACTWEPVSRDLFLRAAGRSGWQGCRPDARSRLLGRHGPAHKDVLPTVQSLPESAVSIAPLGPVAFGGFFCACGEFKVQCLKFKVGRQATLNVEP
jgi:hypothetical protein